MNDDLVNLQAAITNAKMDSKNPHFKSEYASLEAHIAAIKPYLAKYNFALYQTVLNDDKNNIYLLTSLVHKSKERIEISMPLILSKNDMQGLGSAVTYARRYSLACLFNMGSDDDDANLTTQQTTQARAQIPIVKSAPKNEAPISTEQQKELFDLCKNKGISVLALQTKLKEKFGIEKSSEIKIWQYNEIKESMKNEQ